jgi:hypothetical protein
MNINVCAENISEQATRSNLLPQVDNRDGIGLFGLVEDEIKFRASKSELTRWGAFRL